MEQAVVIVQHWCVDPSEYSDGRWIDAGKEYLLTCPTGLSVGHDILRLLKNGHKSLEVLDGRVMFPTMEEAQQYADAFNKSESWGR